MLVHRRYMLLLAAALVAVPACDVFAKRGRGRGGDDDDHAWSDHEEADRARQSGEILPLNEILDDVQKQYPGEVVGVKFEKEDGVWVYEFKMVMPDGRYVEIYVDAKTKQIIKVEGK